MVIIIMIILILNIHIPIPVLWLKVDLTVSHAVPSPRQTPHLSSFAFEWRTLSQPTCYRKTKEIRVLS